MSVRRIAVVADRFPPNWGGGVAAAHYHLVRVLRARGFEVRAFTCFDGPDDGDDGVERARVPAPVVRLIRRAFAFFFSLAEPGRTAYHAADVAIRALGAVPLNGRLRRFRPDVMVVPDHGAPALFLRPIPGCRRVLVAHHNPDRFRALPGIAPASARDIRIALAAERRVLGRCDKVVCPSLYMRDVFRATHAFAGPVEHAPNLVDQAFLDAIPSDDPRPRMGLPADATLVYVPGGGNRFKGAAFLPGLLKRLAAAAGPVGFFVTGAVGDELRRAFAALPAAARVWAPGPLAGDRVVAALKACSFGLYPTLAENYSMALLEGALLGVPMATFAVGGNAEIVRGGDTGLLAPAFDADALGECAVRLLDPAFRAAMAARTLADAAQRLSSAAVADRVVACLTEF